MHQTLDSSDVFGYLHGNVSATAEGSQPEGPTLGPNWTPETFGTSASSSLLARVSRKRLKVESVTVPDDDDFAIVAIDSRSRPRLVMPALNRRSASIMLHEFSISEENLPGRHEPGKKEAEHEVKRKRSRVAEEFFERGIPEPGAENENWYRGMGGSSGLAALKESLKRAQLEDVLSALKSVSEPRGSHWRQLEVPMDFVGFGRAMLPGPSMAETGPEVLTDLGWWLIRPYLPISDSATSNAVTARLFMSLDEVVKCLTLSTDECRGEMPPFRQTFEWRPVGGAAIRKRKRKLDRANFQLQIQGNRQDPCANQPPRFRDFLLRREQLRSLWWMQQQEKMDQVFDLTLCRVRVDPASPDKPIPPGSIKSPQFRELNWQLELARRAFYKVRGGILGDAPGYGKTATTIGLIDSSLAAPPPAIPLDQEPYFFHASATLVLVPSNLLDQWVGEIQKFTRQASTSPASKSGRRDDATLKVLAIKTVSNLKALTVDEICRAAIVICSYRLPYSKVYRARLLELSGTSGVASGACFAESSPIKKSPQDAAAPRGPVDILNLRRNTRRFRETPGALMWNRQVQDPLQVEAQLQQNHQSDALQSSELTFPVLEQIWWKRLVLDEFHELEAIGNTAQFESLRSICAHYRWGLTGTPPTRDLAQVATLAKVFHLGQLPPADDKGGYQTDLAQEMAQHFLDHFARQNTSEEVEPVPLQEHIISVDQTAEERAIYLQASRDVAENSGSALSDEDRAERLIKLCSHFAAYCGMSTASSDAGSECHRIISTKQEHAKKTWKTVLQRAVQLELLWQILGSRAATQEEILKDLGADSSEVGVANSSNSLQGPPAQSHGECCNSAQPPDEGPRSAFEMSRDQEAQKPHDTAGAPSFSSPTASMAAAAFAEASRMPLAQLQTLAGPRFSGSETVEADPSSRLANARCQMVEAVQAAVSAQRSVEFFKRTLAAARGDASADQRSCSICLEEDLKEDQLSITVCAHVFHTDCLKEVVKHFGTCPVCRHSLQGKNKVTPLTLELAPDIQAAKGSKRRGALPHEEMAKKAGSKLAALATHLQSIKPGEKVLVFCQWEDLKKHIAETLQTMGVPHLQLSGNIYQRSDILRRFQETTEDAAQVLLLSLEHAASGTNLTAANHVVFVHPMHASSAERAVAYEAQAIARCRRYGQEKTVHCWRFVARGTIEETITATHRRDLWQDHVEDSKQRANPASHDDSRESTMRAS